MSSYLTIDKQNMEMLRAGVDVSVFAPRKEDVNAGAAAERQQPSVAVGQNNHQKTAHAPRDTFERIPAQQTRQKAPPQRDNHNHNRKNLGRGSEAGHTGGRDSQSRRAANRS